MKMRLVLLILIIFNSAVAHASLGETEAQIETRYGPPKSPPHPWMPHNFWRSYFFQSMIVTVSFIDGVSEKEQFFLSDEKRFTAADAKALLNANALNGKWDGLKGISEYPEPLNLIADKQVIAMASVSNYAILIQSAKYNLLHMKTFPGNISRIKNILPWSGSSLDGGFALLLPNHTLQRTAFGRR